METGAESGHATDIKFEIAMWIELVRLYYCILYSHPMLR